MNRQRLLNVVLVLGALDLFRSSLSLDEATKNIGFTRKIAGCILSERAPGHHADRAESVDSSQRSLKAISV
jgi:hypothetical protein